MDVDERRRRILRLRDDRAELRERLRAVEEAEGYRELLEAIVWCNRQLEDLGDVAEERTAS